MKSAAWSLRMSLASLSVWSCQQCSNVVVIYLWIVDVGSLPSHSLMHPSLTNCRTLTTTIPTYVASFASSYTYVAAGLVWFVGWNCVWNLAICCQLRMLYWGRCLINASASQPTCLYQPNITWQLTLTTLTDRQSLPLHPDLSLFLQINCTVHCRDVTRLCFVTWLSRNLGRFFPTND